MRESYTATLVRLEERLGNLIQSNTDTHKEIIDSIKDLKNHVNDELESFDIRVKKCEDSDKSEAIIYKVAIALLSIALTVITIWKFLK
jgi:hypothetical protein